MNVEHLRKAFRKEMQRRDFEVQSVVMMLDHIHALWQLPVDDFDYSNPWREIKKHVSKSLDAPVGQNRSGNTRFAMKLIGIIT